MEAEVDVIATPYTNAGFLFWATKCSDMESYWCETRVIEAHFGVDAELAETVLNEATVKACENNRAIAKCRKKRNEVMNKVPEARKGELPHFGDTEVETEATKHGAQHKVLGKDLVRAIRDIAQDRKLTQAGGFGKTVPSGLNDTLANELRAALEALL